MHFDFWNNPLVVSAMRLKFRRGSPGLVACLYVLALMGVGSFLYYNQTHFSPPFGRVFLIAILAIQFILSGLISLITVSTSMNAEVNNRTLDFQRIVSLSPREILVGKLLGEPALGYFLAMATVPLVVLCWFQGGATIPAIVLLYVNLVTFMLMCSSVGLLHTLAEPNQTTGKPRSGSIAGLLFFFFAFLPSMIMQGSAMNSNVWSRTAIELLTPVGPLIELKNGDPFAARVDLWGLSFPALAAAPLAQLAVAGWFVQAMSRRLKTPIQPVFGRYDVYMVLTVVDLLVSGMCYWQWQQGWLADQLVAQFFMAHVVACLFLLLGATPSRATLMAWLWRFRGQQSWSRDSLLFSRSEITLALAAMLLIGVGILFVGFLLPVMVATLGGPTQFNWGSLAELLLVSGMLIIALGMTCQLCQALAGKPGIIVFVCVVLVLNIGPPIMAGLMELNNVASPRDSSMDLVYSFSPIVFFVSRTGSGWSYPLPSLPLIISYLLLAWITHGSFRRWRDQRSQSVAQKIKEMTAAPQPS